MAIGNKAASRIRSAQNKVATAADKRNEKNIKYKRAPRSTKGNTLKNQNSAFDRSGKYDRVFPKNRKK